MTVIIVMVIAVAIDIGIVIASVIIVIVSLFRWLSLSSSPSSTSFSKKIIVFMFVCRRFGSVPIEIIFDTEGDESNESDDGEYSAEAVLPQGPSSTKKES